MSFAVSLHKDKGPVNTHLRRGMCVLLVLMVLGCHVQGMSCIKDEKGQFLDQAVKGETAVDFLELWDSVNDDEEPCDREFSPGSCCDPPPSLMVIYDDCQKRARAANPLFPEFTSSHCTTEVENLKTQICGNPDPRAGQYINIMLTRFQDEVLIVSTNGDLEQSRKSWFEDVDTGDEESDSFWVDCGDPVDYGDDSEDEDTDGEEMNCETCVDGRHRGGAIRFKVTSHACAWIPAEMACVGAHTVSGRKKVAMRDDQCIDSRGGEKSPIWSRAPPTQKALLIAYNYPQTASQLGGTVPDIINVFSYLTGPERLFNDYDITIMTDVPADSEFKHPDTQKYGSSAKPISEWFAGANILTKKTGGVSDFDSALTSVISTLNSGDFFVFHYSGHGTFQRDRNGDELDGLDEVLALPNGESMKDDDFYEHLRKIPRGVKAFIMVDACHSEGFSDLPFNYRPRERAGEDHGTWCYDWAKPNYLPEASITYVSGSQNHETSGDLGFGGALTTHAMKHWIGSAGKMREAMANVMEDLTTQDPSLSAWPTFRDNVGDFEPWNRHKTPARDRARTNAMENPTDHELTVPDFCTHGGKNQSKIKHFRRKSKQTGAKEPVSVEGAMISLKIDSTLDDASAVLDVVEGCSECNSDELSTPADPVHEPAVLQPLPQVPVIQPQKPVIQPQKPVIQPQLPVIPTPVQHPTQPARVCECAGLSPFDDGHASQCTDVKANGQLTKSGRRWCYVKLLPRHETHPCAHLIRSSKGAAYGLAASYDACKDQATHTTAIGAGLLLHAFNQASADLDAQASSTCRCTGGGKVKAANKKCTTKFSRNVFGTGRKWCYVQEGACAHEKESRKHKGHWMSPDPCVLRPETDAPMALPVLRTFCTKERKCLSHSPITGSSMDRHADKAPGYEGCSDKTPGTIIGKDGKAWLERILASNPGATWCYVPAEDPAHDQHDEPADCAYSGTAPAKKSRKRGEKKYAISFVPCMRK